VQLPSVDGLAFLLLLLVLVPLGARRTARALEPAGEAGRPPISRERYWRSAITFQVVLLAFAWIVGSGFGYRIFALDGLGPMDLLLAIGAFVLCLLIRLIAYQSRSEAELRRLAVYRRAPRTSSERRTFVLVVLLASVAEEAAYRGVGWSILWYALGSGWISAAILSAAFALAHWSQGWKSLLAIVLLALVFHALVALTGVLLLAMAVHAAYDLLVGGMIQKKAREMDEVQAGPA
jgi:membrane protease YdiL (CAAX protease family)